jgi:hypothetical protein
VPTADEIYIAAVTIDYPAGDRLVIHHKPSTADSIHRGRRWWWGCFADDRDTLDAIKATTDTVNWSDIDAIKDATGVGQAQTAYDKISSVLSAIGTNADDHTAATIFGKIAELKKTIWTDQLSKVNWDDMQSMSEAGVDWSDVAKMSLAGVNWDDLVVLTEEGINWSDIGVE